jgi:hypothetical protein
MRCRDRSSPSGGQPHHPTSGDYQRPTSDQSDGGLELECLHRTRISAGAGHRRKARSRAVAVRREVWRSPLGARASASPPGHPASASPPGRPASASPPGRPASASPHCPGKRVTTRRWAGGHRVNPDSVAGGPKRRVELFGQLGEERASAVTGWLRARPAECHPTPRAASSCETPPDLTGSGGGADRDQLELGVQVGAHSVFGTDLVDDGTLLLVVGHCHRDAAGVVDVRVNRR